MAKETDGAPGISLEGCSYKRVLEIISSKWTVLVIAALSNGTKRYGELRRRIKGVSQKMLTQTLRQLERDGLVKRKVCESDPLITHYELTPIGESVLPHMIQMKEWVGEYYSRIEESRREYDGKHKRA